MSGAESTKRSNQYPIKVSSTERSSSQCPIKVSHHSSKRCDYFGSRCPSDFSRAYLCIKVALQSWHRVIGRCRCWERGDCELGSCPARLRRLSVRFITV